MQLQTNSTPAANSSQQTAPKRHSERTVWIITGYAASALALLGVMAYYFSNFVAR